MENNSNNFRKIPPHNREAEQAVIASLLIDERAIDKVIGIVDYPDFYDPSHQFIFKCIKNMQDKGKPVDVVTLVTELKDSDMLERIGGVEYLASLTEIVPNAANVESYAGTIREKSVLRSVITLSAEMSEKCYESGREVSEIVDEVEQKIFQLAENRLKADIVPIGEVVVSTFAALDNLYRRKEDISGLRTGYKDFDKITNGLQKSDLLILAGRPGMGKTAFALNLALNIAYENKQRGSVAIFSLEMSDQQLVQRLMSALAGVNSGKLRTGNFTMEEWQKLVGVAGELHDIRIFIDDTPSITSMELRAKCRRLKREHGLDLIVVDYLQLMGATKGESREQQISEISRNMKGLAKELNIPIIALSQLNRGVESRTDKRPLISDLRESGAIEQDADIIIFLYRDEVYNKENTPKPNIAEVIIAKHRNGPTGTVELYFEKEIMRFRDADTRSGY